jgi:hypothetical protein
MATDEATDRVKRELHRAIDSMRHDLTRVEILTAALSAFSRPVPEYEPAFRHMHKMTSGVYELGSAQGDA